MVCADEVTWLWDGHGVCGCGPTRINHAVANIIVDPLSYNSHCWHSLSETGQTASVQSAVYTVAHLMF